DRRLTPAAAAKIFELSAQITNVQAAVHRDEPEVAAQEFKRVVDLHQSLLSLLTDATTRDAVTKRVVALQRFLELTDAPPFEEETQ
ncbi:MAG: hypothetical protein AAF961_15760, partial [Planctomycetota bacterium]